MTLAQSLPVEIVDQIIDHLLQINHQGKIHDVAVCGLVCRAWLPSSRYHLFSRPSLTNKNITAFLDVVQTSPFPILSFARYVCISIGSATAASASDSILLRRLEKLDPFLRVTKLRFDSPHLVSDRCRQVVGRSFENITTLQFFIAILPLNSILAALPSFPALERLGFHLVIFAEEEPRQSPSYDFPPTWHALYLTVPSSSSFGEYLFQKLLSLATIPVLSSLSAHETCPEENSFMTEYLRHLGDRLQYLQLEPSCGYAREGELGAGLRYSTDLRCLELNLQNDRANHLAYTALPILRCLRSRKLAKIIVTGIGSNGPLQLDMVDSYSALWQQLDEALAGEWFGNLQSFTIVVKSRTVGTSHLEKYMPWSVSRGILRVVHKPEPDVHDIWDIIPMTTDAPSIDFMPVI
ncbi:hypothetical protein DFH09DRAFT_1370824 [Mycena vulgaris]|nr:hypothetical protein DFH09DRAFT_1370824 [Mycena vulgaris]